MKYLPQLFIKSAIFWCLFGKVLAANYPVNLTELQEGLELDDNLGFMLIDLEVEHASPSVIFTDMNRGGQYEVSLKNKKPGLYVARLRSGSYQIEQVSAPYFDLPYAYKPSVPKPWSFRIESGKTNYIGKLVIRKERSHNSVFVRLINRIAADKDRIDSAAQSLLTKYPLDNAIRYQDDFLAELFNKTESK